jgi:AP-1 complex subunit gamma-1
MECLKLIASPKFHEKRVGYLGLTQLLDENTEILMLVTNSIKNDINSGNQFISGTALCALGNIGNQEMCLALSREVQNQLVSDNPLIRKKAALCAMRIIKKVDDIEDKFNNRLTALLEDKNHGVILSACSLLIHLLETNPKEYLKEFKHCPQLLIKTLRSILMSGYANASEYDFSGIVDPFIQVRILKLIRLFAADSSILSSDELNDILAQIATNTDSSKNSGNAVLYECVQTIMSINAEPGLRVLGINILGKFLTNKDANIKYVALCMLQKVVQVDAKAVQRHRSTVLECLRDPDITIRKRALEVAYSLVNAENVKSLTKELIAYLVSADADFRSDLASRICLCIDKFAPDKRWHIDNTIKVLLLAGNQVSDEVVYSLCHVVAGAANLHAYAVYKLFFALADPEIVQPDSIMTVATWILGEYGHLLVAGVGGSQLSISMSDLLDLFDEVIRKSLAAAADQAAVGKSSTKSATVICEYVVCAITKLLIKTNNVNSPALRDRVLTTLRRFDGSLSVDLQQRVCEFKTILSDTWDKETRAGLLEIIPPSEKSSASFVQGKPIGDVNVTDAIPVGAQTILDSVRAIAQNKGALPVRRVRVTNPSNNKSSSQAGLTGGAKAGFDLDDLLGDATVIPTAVPTTAPKVNDDLLNDLFG